MVCSRPGFPVYQQNREFTQAHIHLVNDAIQPSHSLPYPSSSTFNFPNIWIFSSESVLHIRWPKFWSFIFGISPSKVIQDSPLVLTGLISLQFKGLSRIFSSTTVQKHQSFSVQHSLYPNSDIHT